MKPTSIAALLTLACVLAFDINAEEIKGRACYRFSDNESLLVARDIALSLAKREALESYSVFVESASALENAQLRNDLITSLSAGMMQGLRITDKREDLERREICISVQAEVKPVEVKKVITSRLNKWFGNEQNLPTGLPENETIRVVRVETDHCTMFSGPPDKCVRFTILCKTPNDELSGNLFRAIWYAPDGIPAHHSYNIGGACYREGEVTKTELLVPDTSTGLTYSIDFLR